MNKNTITIVNTPTNSVSTNILSLVSAWPRHHYRQSWPLQQRQPRTPQVLRCVLQSRAHQGPLTSILGQLPNHRSILLQKAMN